MAQHHHELLRCAMNCLRHNAAINNIFKIMYVVGQPYFNIFVQKIHTFVGEEEK